MYGMEKTGSGKRCRRGFISRCFSPLILCLGLLFSSWNNVSALFSGYFVDLSNPQLISRGNPRSLSAVISPRDEYMMGIRSAYVDALIVRDAVWFSPGITGISLELDTVFIPAFTEYLDTGIKQTIWPVGAVLGMRADFLREGPFYLSLRGYAGFEHINYYYNRFLYGGGLESAYRLNESLVLGLFGGYSDQKALLLELDMLYFTDAFSANAGFEMDGHYYSLKAGTEIKLNESYHLLFGGDLTLSYGGWSAMGGLLMKDISFFKRESDLTVMMEFSPPLSITVSLGLELGAKTALTDSPTF